MSDMLLKGSVEKNNIWYKWVTEPNACPKCQKLEGRLFNSKEEFEAARPHPHCKCSYEKVFIDINTQAKLQRLDDINAKFADLETKSEELGEKLESALISLKMAKEFVREKIAKLDKDMKLALNQAQDLYKKIISAIDACVYWKNKFGSWKDIMENSKNNNNLTEEEKESQLNKLQLELNEIIQKASIACPEAANLWKLSTSKFNDNLDYVENNGKLLNSFIDIEEPSIRTAVKEKLESQGMSLKSRGVRFSYDSSLADALIKSNGLKKYIIENRDKFKPNTSLPKVSLGLFNVTFNDFDLFVGIHNTDIEDIYIDFYERFNAKVIDTYDFNAGEWLQLVQMGNILQNEEKIENYFIVVDIIIPKDIWENY